MLFYFKYSSADSTIKKVKSLWRKNITASKKCIGCLESQEEQKNNFQCDIIKIRSLLFSDHKTITSRRMYCCSRRCQDAVIELGIDPSRLRPFEKPLSVEWRIHSWLVRNCRDSNLYKLPSLKHLFTKNNVLRRQLIQPRVLNHNAAIRTKRKTRLCAEIMTEKQLVAWCGHKRQHIEKLANCGPYPISIMAVIIFLTQFYRKIGFYCIAALYGYTRQTSVNVYDAVRAWLMKYYVPTQLITANYESNKKAWTRDIIKNATPAYYYALHNKPVTVVPLEPHVIQTKEDEKEATRVYFEWVRKNWISELELKAREENRIEGELQKKGIQYPQGQPPPPLIEAHTIAPPPIPPPLIPLQTPPSLAQQAPSIPPHTIPPPLIPPPIPPPLAQQARSIPPHTIPPPRRNPPPPLLSSVRRQVAREQQRQDNPYSNRNKDEDSSENAQTTEGEEEEKKDVADTATSEVNPLATAITDTAAITTSEESIPKLNSEKYSHIIIASDGTYGYVQRINQHTIAQKSWSGQKHRVLYKPHVTIAVNGKAILCQTFYSNGHNNDQSISNAQTSAAYVRWCRNNLNDPQCIFSKEQIDELLYFQQHVYLPGDVHLADGGYYYALDERLISPPRVQKSAGDAQFSIHETNEKARVTLCRGVIERYFAIVKRYKMLGEQLNWHHLRYYDEMWKIGCALTNDFAPVLTADCPRNDNIVARIDNCEEQKVNLLEEAVEDYNHGRAASKTKGWTTEAIGFDNVVHFLRELPWLQKLELSVADWNFYCGARFLCKISYAYLRALGDKLELRVANNQPHVLRFSKIRSKFRSGKEHTVFLNFAQCCGEPTVASPWNRTYLGRDHKLWGNSCLKALQHYCSTCAGGRRLIIPDIHCSVALLLCIAIKTDTLQKLRTAELVEQSLPANIIDAEPSKTWLEEHGISKKQVMTHQRLLNKEKKIQKGAGRKKKTRGTTTKRKKRKPPPKRNLVSNSNAASNSNSNAASNSNSNAASNSNHRIQFFEDSQDENKDNSESEDHTAAAENMNSRFRVDIDYAGMGVHTVECDMCGDVIPLFDEIEDQWDAADEPYHLCQSCISNI